MRIFRLAGGAILLTLLLMFAGCLGRAPEETTAPVPEMGQPVPEQPDTPEMIVEEQLPDYLGLSEVFNGVPKIPVSTKDIDITDGNVQLKAFLAQPADGGRYPGVVMIHEWWGLNDQVKSIAHVLAGEGYVVLAVDLFEGKVAATPEEAQRNIRENPNEKTVPRLVAAAKYLKSQSNVDPSRVASLGWCYGGGQSFQLGINEDLRAVVIYYGSTSADKSVLAGLKEPVLGIFGAADRGISVENVKAFESAVKELGGSVEIHLYEGAPHAFANPTNTQAFRKDQAIDAWIKTLDFLKRTLG